MCISLGGSWAEKACPSLNIEAANSCVNMESIILRLTASIGRGKHINLTIVDVFHRSVASHRCYLEKVISDSQWRHMYVTPLRTTRLLSSWSIGTPSHCVKPWHVARHTRYQPVYILDFTMYHVSVTCWVSSRLQSSRSGIILFALVTQRWSDSPLGHGIINQSLHIFLKLATLIINWCWCQYLIFYLVIKHQRVTILW